MYVCQCVFLQYVCTCVETPSLCMLYLTVRMKDIFYTQCVVCQGGWKNPIVLSGGQRPSGISRSQTLKISCTQYLKLWKVETFHTCYVRHFRRGINLVEVIGHLRSPEVKYWKSCVHSISSQEWRNTFHTWLDLYTVFINIKHTVNTSRVFLILFFNSWQVFIYLFCVLYL